MSYKFEYTEEDGWEHLKVPRTWVNEVIPRRKISFIKSFFMKHKVVFNPEQEDVVIYQLNTILTKTLLIGSTPLLIIMMGLANFSEVLEEIKENLNEEKYGNFSTDNIYYASPTVIARSHYVINAKVWIKKYSKTGGIE